MLKLIISVAVGPAGEILIAGSHIQVFSAKGDFAEEINAAGKGTYRFGIAFIGPSSREITCIF